MSTPVPSGASKRPVGSVTTPSHLNHTSPAPRSVPSPVTSRHAAGKTPVNPATGGSSSGRTLGGTPMMQSGSNQSPSGGHMPSGTPTFAIDGATPAGMMSLPTPGMAGTSGSIGGASMIPTMSDLGLTASGQRRNEDDERRARMRRVLRALGRRHGRVSEEGIARVSRRVGFANDIDAVDGEDSAIESERRRRIGNRPVTMAGNTVMVEIDLRDNIPRRVAVTHNVQTDALQHEASRAADVLMRDLRAPDGVALRAKLDRFAINLDTLARTDRLSSNRINCFEALNGVYTSLQRLYRVELQAAKALLGLSEADNAPKAETIVMCQKSGVPTVHARNKIGLEVAYWRQNCHTGNSNGQKDIDMDVDGADQPMSDPTSDEDMFRLQIETEVSLSSLYPSMRVSDAWLPEVIELPAADSGDGLPWQDPPPTYLAVHADGDSMAGDVEQKLPDLRFVAHLHPPIVMPYEVAVQLLGSVGLPAPAVMTLPPQYASALLEPGTVHVSGTVFSTSAEQTVLQLKDNHEAFVTHQYVLDTTKPDWSHELTALPFSHPRQLVDALPTLRQWACIGSLLKQAFNRGTAPLSEEPPHASNAQTSVVPASKADLTLSSMASDVMSSSEAIDDAKVPVNIALTTSPVPSMNLVFPNADQSQLSNVTVQVCAGAGISVTAQDGSLADGNQDHAVVEQDQARALDVCGDLGVWIEWVRNHRA